MNDILKENRTAVSALVFFLVVLPGFFFGYYLLLGQIQEKTDAIEKVKIDQKVNENFIASVSQLRQNRDDVVANEDKLSLLLGSDASAKIALYGDIESIARSTGHSSVTNEIIDPDLQVRKRASVNDEVNAEAMIEPSNENALIVRVSLVGTYENFLNFIHQIEHFGYLADIQSINLTARALRETDSRSRSVRQQEEAAPEDPRENLIDSQVEIAVYLDTILSDRQDDAREELDAAAAVDAEMDVEQELEG